METTYCRTEKVSSLPGIRSRGREGQEGENMKKHKQSFGDDGDVPDRDCAAGCTCVLTPQTAHFQ